MMSANRTILNFDQIRSLVVLDFNRYNMEMQAHRAKFKESNSSDASNNWSWLPRPDDKKIMKPASGKEKRVSTRKGGGYPVQGERLMNEMQSWSPASPIDGLETIDQLMLNYFYNPECEDHRFLTKLRNHLWALYRETFKGRAPKAEVMTACFDMLEQVLYRTRRRWIKGAKFKDFQYDDAVGNISKANWSLNYKPYWDKIKEFVAKRDESCLLRAYQRNLG